MQHLLSKKLQDNAAITRSTQILRVADVKVVMQRYVPVLWSISAMTADEKRINSYYLRKFSGESEQPHAGEIIVADLLTMSDAAGDLNEIIEINNLSRSSRK
jgi:hypothetical protein